MNSEPISRPANVNTISPIDGSIICGITNMELMTAKNTVMNNTLFVISLLLTCLLMTRCVIASMSRASGVMYRMHRFRGGGRLGAGNME